MIQTRNKVFETNSSMTHSLVICKLSDYSDWLDGKLMFRYSDKSFLPINEALKENAKLIRQNLESAKQYLKKDDTNDGTTKYCEKLLKKFTPEFVEKYESGEYQAKKWEIYNHYDFEEYFITFKEWDDYVVNHLEMYDICDSDVIDGVKVVAFGYYGHD